MINIYDDDKNKKRGKFNRQTRSCRNPYSNL